MIAQISIILVFAFILGVIIAVVRNNGKQAEKIRSMRETAEREAKERQRANKVVDSVRNESDDGVRARLRKISEGHNRNSL